MTTLCPRSGQSALQNVRRALRPCFTPKCRMRYGPRWSSTLERQWSTPLAKHLAGAIATTGPISIANFMRQCLTSDAGGYYTRQLEDGADQFGKSGDFVTSPEISQIFGELVGIWFVAEWMAQGKKAAGVQLLELGPGRGTLMSDILRTIGNFKPMASAIETIYLVEASSTLRDAQAKLLCGSEPVTEHKLGFSSKSKHFPNAQIVWTEDASFLPKEQGKTPFIIAHEFFDALPIHAFTSVAKAPSPTKDSHRAAPTAPTEWRELLVSPTAPPSPFDKPSSTPRPEFEMTTSPTPTHHSRLLPALSPRYQALLPTPGSTIEISPAARTTASLLARLIAPPRAPQSGAALIVDYGPASTIPVNTLRGVRQHRRVSPFDAAGRVDVSADVDFGAIVEAALDASPAVEAHGPVEQGVWLAAMGGRERCDALAARAADAEAREAVRKAWERLVDRGAGGMGALYKVLAIVPEAGGRRRPVGFGGGVGA